MAMSREEAAAQARARLERNRRKTEIALEKAVKRNAKRRVKEEKDRAKRLQAERKKK